MEEPELEECSAKPPRLPATLCGIAVAVWNASVGANFVAPRFDVLVFVFALLVSLVTSLLFGTIPALQASRGIGGNAAARGSHDGQAAPLP